MAALRPGARIARALALAALLGSVAAGASAGPADVISASAECAGVLCSFRVTVRHADEGWSHYANAWEIVAPDDHVLATRVLRHPHVDEQPFTRELAGVRVPAGIESVRIRARDSMHGLGGQVVVVPLGAR
jgi:hypothetical protein